MTVLTKEEASRLFKYEPTNGQLRWKVRPCQRVRIGDVAGTRTTCGYLKTAIKARQHQCHRIVWAMFHDVIPVGFQIDHINGDRSDNRIENLRLVDTSSNLANSKLPKTNTSGERGVNWAPHANKWECFIKVKGKQIYLGYFDDKAEAGRAYRAAAEKHFGEFAAHLCRPLHDSREYSE